MTEHKYLSLSFKRKLQRGKKQELEPARAKMVEDLTPVALEPDNRLTVYIS